LALILAAGGVALWLGRSRTAQPDAPLTAVPLTSYPGDQSSPTFSPDGNQVAFCWDGEKQDNVDIYVKLVGAGPRLRLTTDSAEDCQPAWSPDGRFIAFLRKLPDNRAAVILTSPLGGAERKLAESFDFLSKPAWSPDSKWLVIADKSATTERDALFLLSVEREKRRLTTPPGRLGSDGNPAFSPDGRILAFVRSPSRTWGGTVYQGDIYTLSLSGDFQPLGEPKRLTFENRYTSSPAWTADGRFSLVLVRS
jgi:Tol biopolymer transport system component